MQEKQIIEGIKKLSQAKYIGDDCAFLTQENLLVSSDSLIEDVHFLPSMPAYYLGWKTVAVNISDIAAMGGIPQYFLLAASLPQACTESWLQDFMCGLNDCCQEYQVLLIGGDLTASSEKIYLCGTILGKSLNNKVALRSQAKPKDKIIVTGTFGNSAAGLWAIQNNFLEDFEDLIEVHYKPMPRIQEGLSLLQNKQRPLCMMDSSDGLLDCLQQISAQSQVKVKIDLNKIPFSSNLIKCALKAKIDYCNWLLIGGEDYELVATTSEAFDEHKWQIIGEVEQGFGVELIKDGKFFDQESLKIFAHFC